MDRLGALGAEYHDPVAEIDWDAAAPDLKWLTPGTLCLAALEGGADASSEDLIRFSRAEFARLCAAGLWLEGLLISRLTARGFPAARADEARVMLQEVREESGHGLMFLEMIDRAGFTGVRLLGPTRLLTWVAHRLAPDSAEFWAMVYVGETVTDTLAVLALREAADGSPICPVARQVLTLHHRDEARHIAAARSFLKARVADMGWLRRRLFSGFFRFLLRRFLWATLYPTEASLRAVGVSDAKVAARAARACPDRAKLAAHCAAPALSLLARTRLTVRPVAEI